MKNFLMIGGMLVALAIVSAAVYPLHAEEEAPSPAAGAPKDAPKPDEGGESKKPKDKDISGGRFAGDPVFVHLAPITLPVISDQGVEQLVTIAIDLEVKDFDVADSIHSNMPRVQDALMTALYGGLGQGSLRNGKLVDINKIKSKILVAIGNVVGADGIRNVLVQGVSQRML